MPQPLRPQLKEQMRRVAEQLAQLERSGQLLRVHRVDGHEVWIPTHYKARQEFVDLKEDNS